MVTATDNLDLPKATDGIVNTAADPVQQTTSYKAPEVKPITTEVDAGQETVESRLNNLTETGSKYTELAKNDAVRTANSRGLINSTMAAGAGTEAAIRSALPIAQQDAKTYSDTRLNNQAAENEFLKNRQSADLNMETAGYQSQLTKDEYGAKTDEDIRRDETASALNMARDEWQSTLKMTEMNLDADLKERVESFLNDDKFTDETKLQIVTTMNTINTDFNQQITDIGMSDRSAEQQATAIDLLTKQRDSQLAVYQDLLGTFNDWDWGTDFTPASTQTTGEAANWWNAPYDQKPTAEPQAGDIVKSTRYNEPDMSYVGNGVWEPVQTQTNPNDSYYR